MRFMTMLIVGASLLFTGCQGVGNGSEDTAVDQALSQPGLPAKAPQAGPGEPQKDFEQQTLQALNP